MKRYLFVFVSIGFWINSSAQNKKADCYDSLIDNKNIQVQMKMSDEKHIISFSRKADSLKFRLEINPSLKAIFDSVSYLNKNKQVFMRISRVDENLYQIDQMNFLNLDGRNISLHKDSDEFFNMDLRDFEVRMIDCQNCTDVISFSIYDRMD